MSVSAYRRTIRASENPRDIERQIFSRITAALTAAGPAFDAAREHQQRMSLLNGALQPALADNLRLWARLRSDLSHPENQLPAPLRAQLISLAHFVDRHTSAILRGEGEVMQLVSINQTIIAGLAGVTPAQAAL